MHIKTIRAVGHNDGIEAAVLGMGEYFKKIFVQKGLTVAEDQSTAEQFGKVVDQGFDLIEFEVFGAGLLKCVTMVALHVAQIRKP